MPATLRVRALGASLLLACGLACAREAAPPAPPEPDPASLRHVDQGDVVGFVGGYGSHVWRGIPFAKPPVGALRWRAPERPEPWGGTREALVAGAACPQFTSPFGGVPGPEGSVVGDEDCLVLDVYAPRMAPDELPAVGERLPVLVWIHGGGNTIGHTGFYDGGRLAQSQRVVVVATQYRLGPLGWLRHAALRAGGRGADDASGNYGTLDLVRALAWVRQNVAAFGGDPDNVTIFGESAGGTNVFTLLLSPRARGLFHRAIAQSGGLRTSDPDEAENFVDDPERPGDAASSNEAVLRLLETHGEAATREQAKARLAAFAPSALADWLRARSPVEILAAYADDDHAGLLRMPKLFRDGAVLPAGEPLELFAAGRWNVVPVVMGTNRDENKLFLFADPRWVRRWFGIFPRLRDREAYELAAGHLSRLWKARGADEPARAMRRVSPDVWVYRFDWDEEPSVLGADLSLMLGAAHGFEIPFVFGHFDLGRGGRAVFDDANRPGREELSRRMMSYWVAFAESGAPGSGRDGSLPAWQAWSPAPDGPRFLVLDTEADGGVRMSSESLTTPGAVAEIESDPVLRERDDRCTLLAEIARWSDYEAPADCS